jgi:hypothetical protein
MQQFGNGKVRKVSEVLSHQALEGAKEDVRRFVQGVIDDYRARWSRAQSFDVLNQADPELAHAYMMLEDRVTLLPPPSLD